MTSRYLRYLSVALVALAMVATVAGGSADAKKKHGVGKSVDSSEIEDGAIVCADIAAAVFPNGCPDDDSGAGTGTGTGTGTGVGASGITLFNARLTASQAHSATVNGFLFEHSADVTGTCQDTFVSNGLAFTGQNYNNGNTDGFNAPGSPVDLNNADTYEHGGVGTLSGSAFVSWVIANDDSVTGICILSGHIVG